MTNQIFCICLHMTNSLGHDVGFDVFLLDPEGIAEPVRWKLSPPDQSPDLLLAKAQIRGGFLNGEEEGLGVE